MHAQHKYSTTQLNIFAFFGASTLMIPYLHQFSAMVLFGTNLHYIWCEFSVLNKNDYAGTAPSESAI